MSRKTVRLTEDEVSDLLEAVSDRVVRLWDGVHKASDEGNEALAALIQDKQARLRGVLKRLED
jgi:hypothetical protein